MKKTALYVGILVAAAGGFGAGDFFARTMLVVDANRLLDITRLSGEATEQTRTFYTRARVEQALWTAEYLRGGNTAEAIRLSESVIESAGEELERMMASRAQTGDASEEWYDALRTRIAEYQSQYPWVPPAPDPNAEEFASRVGGWRPFIRDGQVSLRVLGVQPGSVFSRLGLKDGELIVAVNGRPVDDAMSELVTALERGDPVALTIESANGETREVRGATEPQGQ